MGADGSVQNPLSAEIARSSETIDELICRLLVENYRLGILQCPDEGTALIIRVQRDRYESQPEDGFIRVEKQHLKGIKFKPVPQNFIPLADELNKFIVDEDWYAKRDKRLRVRSDPWLEGNLVAPSSMLELILSYTSAPIGHVKLKREFGEITRGDVYLVEMELCFILESPNIVQKETMHIDLERLKKLVLKRKEARCGIPKTLEGFPLQ